MKNVSIRAKVIKIEPGAQYEGKTYDQYIFLELSNDVVIDVFDYLMQVDQKMLGKTVSITLLLFLSDIECLSEEVYEVSSNPDKYRDLTSGGHCFSGKVTAIDMANKKITLDVGIGELLVDPSLLVKRTYTLGSFIRACPARVDLIDVLEEIEYCNSISHKCDIDE